MAGWPLALLGLGAVLVLMTGTWLVSLQRRDVSIVDRVWGMSFVVQAWLWAWLGDGALSRRLLLATLVTVWGVRLSAYITWRNWGEGEDKRYAAMRRRDPEGFPVRSLVTVFWTQAVLSFVVAGTLLFPMIDPTPDHLTWVDAVGAVVWAVGMFFEAVGDVQLSRFLADPANRRKVMDRGLWRYTRHPNYFGDTVVWWGFYVVALAVGAWWAFYGALVMTVLIVRVSGVALTEKGMSGGSKRAGYDDYVRRTNAFIPGPPSRRP